MDWYRRAQEDIVDEVVREVTSVPLSVGQVRKETYEVTEWVFEPGHCYRLRFDGEDVPRAVYMCNEDAQFQTHMWDEGQVTMAIASKDIRGNSFVFRKKYIVDAVEVECPKGWVKARTLVMGQKQ